MSDIAIPITEKTGGVDRDCRYCGRNLGNWQCMNTRDMELMAADSVCFSQLEKLGGGERCLMKQGSDK